MIRVISSFLTCLVTDFRGQNIMEEELHWCSQNKKEGGAVNWAFPLLARLQSLQKDLLEAQPIRKENVYCIVDITNLHSKCRSRTCRTASNSGLVTNSILACQLHIPSLLPYLQKASMLPSQWGIVSSKEPEMKSSRGSDSTARKLIIDLINKRQYKLEALQSLIGP